MGTRRVLPESLIFSNRYPERLDPRFGWEVGTSFVINKGNGRWFDIEFGKRLSPPTSTEEKYDTSERSLSPKRRCPI
jgi:hypothetical protein